MLQNDGKIEQGMDKQKGIVKVVNNERLLLKEIKELCEENIYWTLIVILFPHLKGIALCCKSGELQKN